MGIKKEAISDLCLTYRKITMPNQSDHTAPHPNIPQHSAPLSANPMILFFAMYSLCPIVTGKQIGRAHV